MFEHVPRPAAFQSLITEQMSALQTAAHAVRVTSCRPPTAPRRTGGARRRPAPTVPPRRVPAPPAIGRRPGGSRAWPTGSCNWASSAGAAS